MRAPTEPASPPLLLTAMWPHRSGASNPGSATPESLHRLYKNQAAVTANPYTLRLFNSHGSTSAALSSGGIGAMLGRPAGPFVSRGGQSRRGCDSPPRQSFRYVSLNTAHGVLGGVTRKK